MPGRVRVCEWQNPTPMAATTVQVTQTPGTVYPLAELLQAWQLESLLPGGLPPSRLRAQLVPIADTDEALLPHVAAGTPTLCSPELATGVHRQVTGGDALAWVSSARWNDFGQKIAFVGGWAEPGTPLVDEKSLTLVGSFSEVRGVLGSHGGRHTRQALAYSSVYHAPCVVRVSLVHTSPHCVGARHVNGLHHTSLMIIPSPCSPLLLPPPTPSPR